MSGIRVALVAAMWVSAHQAWAQDPLPIQITVRPSVVAPGGAVVVKGTTTADGRRMTVGITLTPPTGAPAQFTGPITKEGVFSIALPKQTAIGTYRVLVKAPDGRGQDTASFRVGLPAAIADEAGTQFGAVLDAADHAVNFADSALSQIPASPAKVEAEQKMQELKQKLATRSQSTSQFRAALDKIQKIPTKYPDATPAFEPVLDALGEVASESREEIVKRNQDLIESGKNGKQCEMINAASEGIKVASALANVAGTFIGVATTFFKDFAGDWASSHLPASLKNDAGYQFATNEMVKVGPTYLQSLEQLYGTGAGPVNSATANMSSLHDLAADASTTVNRYDYAATAAAAIPGLMYDLAGLVVGKVFDKYCEKFEGPMRATLQVAFDRAADVWWKYTIAIEGKLALRYAKPDAPGDAVKLNGEFVGSGTKFTVWENALRVLYPKLMNGAILVGKDITPPGFPYTEAEGKYLPSLTPTGFFIPVEGELVGTKLTLRIQPARTDFEGINAKGIYVIMSPLSLAPATAVFNMPYKGGRFVIVHALSLDHDEPLELPVTIDTKRKLMYVDKHINRANVSGPGNLASYTMDLKLCNPQCPN